MKSLCCTLCIIVYVIGICLLLSSNSFYFFHPSGNVLMYTFILLIIPACPHTQQDRALVGSSLPLAANENGKRSAASFRFDFRDQKLNATVRLSPQRPVLAWQGKHAVTLMEEKANLRFRWDVTPQLGFVESLDFRFSPGFPANWRVRAEEGSPAVHHWERLQIHEALPHLLHLGSQHGVQSALVRPPPAGSRWRVHLTEPLGKKSAYVIEADMPAGLLEKETQQFSLHMPRRRMGMAGQREAAPACRKRRENACGISRSSRRCNAIMANRK